MWPRVLASLRARREIQLCKLAKEYFWQGIHPSSRSGQTGQTFRSHSGSDTHDWRSIPAIYLLTFSPNLRQEAFSIRNLTLRLRFVSDLKCQFCFARRQILSCHPSLFKFVLIGLNFVQSDSVSLSLRCLFCQKRSIFSPSPTAPPRATT